MTQTTIQHTPVSELHSQIIKLCHKMELPLHYNHKGPKTFTNYQRVALIVLYHRSKKALRDFVAELYESFWPKWLGLREIPGKSTINDWMKIFNLSNIKMLHNYLIEKQNPKIVAIDGTGIETNHRSKHYEWRICQKYFPCAKLDALIDVETSLILDYKFRLKLRHEIISAKSIFRKMSAKNVLILGDGAYDCEELHRIARKKNNELFAPLRKTSRKTPKGFFRKKCLERNPKYGLRNKVESVFHALKAVHVSALKSRLNSTKKKEMAWQVLVYNLKRIKNFYLIWIKCYSGQSPQNKNI
jgi:hypothetical protein